MQENARYMVQGKVISQEEATVEAEVNKTAAAAISAFGVVIGLWSAACLVSAMVQTGGPLQLVSSWFGAVTGM